MNVEQKDELLENIKYIVKKLSKTEIRNSLMFFYEINETPEIIAINRQTIHVEGFVKINRRIFFFSIAFLQNNDKTVMKLELQYGKQTLEKSEEIFIIEYNDSLEVQLADNKQYLFSVYF